MKNIKKAALLFSATLVGGFAMTSCQDDENLDLTGIPETNIGVDIDGQEDGISEVVLKGVYNQDGVLEVDGSMTRTYRFALQAPSLEDFSFEVEPLLKNISAEQVEISGRKFMIPAGERTPKEDVTITLLDEDYKFMEGVNEAKVYELGVRIVDAEGYKPAFVNNGEAKVVLNKEAYCAHYSVAFAEGAGNEENFIRMYAKGKILSEGKVSKKFKVQVDRPVLNDTKFTLKTLGLPEGFEKCIHLTPEEVTIPAGAKESDVMEWSLDDDYLLANDKAEEFDFTFEPVEVEDSEWASFDKSARKVKVGVEKRFYLVKASFVTINDDTKVRITRKCVDGKIINKEPIEVKAKIRLNSDALEPVTVLVSAEGMPSEFAKDQTLTPTKVVIPVGSSESEEIKWTVTDDFLMTTPDAVTREVKLHAEFEDPKDPTLEFRQQDLGITISKVLVLMEVATPSSPRLPRIGWSNEILTPGVSDEPGNILDDDPYSSVQNYGENLELEMIVDIKAVHLIKGFSWKGYFSDYGFPNKISLQLSEDKVTWNDCGMIDCKEAGASDEIVISLLKPQKARYLKVKGYDGVISGWTMYCSDLNVYGE